MLPLGMWQQVLTSLMAHPTIEARRVDAVWLFGSHAAGTAGPDSDVDLGVLCRPRLGVDRFALVDEVANAVGCEVDVVDLDAVPATTAWQVITTGRLVVCTDDLAVHDFLRATRHGVDDEERRNRMILLAGRGGP
jgi:predicted nucleotidyltransferase